MERAPNQHDATIYQRMQAVLNTATHAEARAWFFEHFDVTSYAELAEKYPRGSRERHLLAEFLGFYESAGVLVSRGLLHEDVFFDAPFGLEMVWAKIGTILDEWQAAANDPAVWENVAWLGKRQEIWLKTRWRPKLEAILPDRGPD
jgi:hypothetical protein